MDRLIESMSGGRAAMGKSTLSQPKHGQADRDRVRGERAAMGKSRLSQDKKGVKMGIEQFQNQI